LASDCSLFWLFMGVGDELSNPDLNRIAIHFHLEQLAVVCPDFRRQLPRLGQLACQLRWRTVCARRPGQHRIAHFLAAGYVESGRMKRADYNLS
jgi:hypothetical protein